MEVFSLNFEFHKTWKYFWDHNLHIYLGFCRQSLYIGTRNSWIASNLDGICVICTARWRGKLYVADSYPIIYHGWHNHPVLTVDMAPIANTSSVSLSKLCIAAIEFLLPFEKISFLKEFIILSYRQTHEISKNQLKFWGQDGSGLKFTNLDLCKSSPNQFFWLRMGNKLHAADLRRWSFIRLLTLHRPVPSDVYKLRCKIDDRINVIYLDKILN